LSGGVSSVVMEVPFGVEMNVVSQPSPLARARAGTQGPRSVAAVLRFALIYAGSRVSVGSRKTALASLARDTCC
jgi:hypothetical protein